jgi:spore coat protein CotH
MNVRFSIWRDGSTGAYEVVCWDSDRAAVVVQTNILTREKAEHALTLWRVRTRAAEIHHNEME